MTPSDIALLREAAAQLEDHADREEGEAALHMTLRRRVKAALDQMESDQCRKRAAALRAMADAAERANEDREEGELDLRSDDAKDAARYRFLRDVPMARWPQDLFSAIQLQLNGRWDTAIDAAMARSKT